MKYTCILFDLDGTLIDTNDLILRTFNYTLDKILGISVPKEQIFATYGRPLSEVMAEFNAEQAERLLTTYRTYNAQIHDQYVTLFPQVKETLTALKNLGLRLAVVTSKKNDIAQRGLRLFDLEPYFDVLIGPDDTSLHKPDPAPAQEALHRLNCPAHEAIMVGDSPYDILCGASCGCKTAAVRYSVHDRTVLQNVQPDYMLDTLADLLPIVTA